MNAVCPSTELAVIGNSLQTVSANMSFRKAKVFSKAVQFTVRTANVPNM